MMLSLSSNSLRRVGHTARAPSPLSERGSDLAFDRVGFSESPIVGHLVRSLLTEEGHHDTAPLRIHRRNVLEGKRHIMLRFRSVPQHQNLVRGRL